MSKILDRKQLVLDAMDNKPVERVPAGFWFHFLADEIHSNAFEQPELNRYWLERLSILRKASLILSRL